MQIFTRQFIKDLIFTAFFIILLYFITHNPITHPTPQPTIGKWSIQLMQSPILFGIAGHNYLVLHDENGNVIEELQGLATNSITGIWNYVGMNSEDKLKVWEFPAPGHYPTENNPGIVLEEGLKNNITGTWKKAVSCKDSINSKDLSYPPFGVNISGVTENSNSVAYTLALCMGLDIKHIGIFTPGETTNLLK